MIHPNETSPCECDFNLDNAKFIHAAGRMYEIPSTSEVTTHSEIDMYPTTNPIPEVYDRRADFLAHPHGHGNAVNLAAVDVGLGELPFGEFPSMIGSSPGNLAELKY